MSRLTVSPGRTGPSRATAEVTIERQSAQLDARSIVALEWSTHWLGRHASVKAPASVVIRRALQVYSDRLSTLDPVAVAGEARQVRDAAKGSGNAITLTEARARMLRHQETYRGPGAPGPQPMGHWHDMLHSIEERRQARESIARVNALMAEQFPDGGLSE